MNDQAWPAQPVETTTDLAAWLTDQAGRHNLTYLLAHAYDGVIWGRVKNGRLSLAGAELAQVAVDLKWDTLQEAYLFSPAGMLYLWAEAGHFQYYLLVDEDLPPERIDTRYRLWGQATSQTAGGFTLMEEGVQGLRHAPPLELAPGTPAALQLRHYIRFDAQDQAYIAFSRLVDLVPLKGGV